MSNVTFNLRRAGAAVAMVSVAVLGAQRVSMGQAQGDRPMQSFQRVGTFANYHNNVDMGDETVSEIVAATADGKTLVYTDSPGEAIGFVDISNPVDPQPGGKVALDGEPTSVDVLSNKYALVAVNTSDSFVNTSGQLVVVDVSTHAIVHTLELGGQPDSLKISHDGRFAAVVIENERDEDLDWPSQAPAGRLAVIRMQGQPNRWTRTDVPLTGLAVLGPQDPEPEFVDINRRNEAVVTLQENNHVAVVDLESASVIRHFPLGTVSLTDIDANEDGVIDLNDSLDDIPREPDAVAWIPLPADQFLIATANEGDFEGGSRGFTLFREDGTVAYDSASTFEWIAVRHGHYPEDRSENKGSEPESILYAKFENTDYLFVGSERGSFVAVYTLDSQGQPTFSQFLPGPLGPEGLLAIPHRGLLIASGEEDDPSFGVRSSVMVYQLQPGAPVYPHLVSTNDGSGHPIPWSALSGMTATGNEDEVYAVWDSYYSESRIFTIDTSSTPAVITRAETLHDGQGETELGYDPEGIAVASDGTRWIASEGNASGSRQNLLVQVDASGLVLQEVSLPAAILACRAASTSTTTLGSGFEGVEVVDDGDGTYRLYVAQQRGWNYTTAGCEDLDDDGGGIVGNEPLQSRIWIYDPFANAGAGSWDAIAWQLAAKPANASWVGLSEITRTPWGDFILIERDNRTGDITELKTLVMVSAAALADGIVTAGEKRVFDLLPALNATHGWITDKPEGVAITPDGDLFLVTDNDGVEDWSGETWFLNLGPYTELFD